MAKNEHHFAVVVGINKYPSISDLKYSVNDSNAFKAWLLDPDGGNLPEENVRSLSLADEDQQGALERVDAKPDRLRVVEAILASIKQAEQAFQDNPSHWQSCRFYFFGSGHGFTPHAREAALLMANSGPDMYGENIGTTRLAELLEERQPFSEILIFADCCRQRVHNAPVGGLPFTRVQKENGIVKVFGAKATRFGDLAYESGDPELQFSYFTQALLEGLRGEGLKEGETVVTSSALQDFLDMRVRDLTDHKIAAQVPEIHNNRADPFVITKIKSDARALDRFHLKFPPRFGERVRLQDGQFNPLDAYGEHDTSDGAWPVSLKFGLYKLVRAEDGGELPLDHSGMFQVTSGKGEHVFIHSI